MKQKYVVSDTNIFIDLISIDLLSAFFSFKFLSNYSSKYAPFKLALLFLYKVQLNALVLNLILAHT